MENFQSIAVTERFAEIPALNGASQQRCTIWKNLDAQRKSGLFCDVTLQCDGGQLHAHKSILSSLSSYFKVLFTTSLSQPSTQLPHVVNFQDFSVEAIGAVLDIVYSSGNISTNRLLDILRFAEYTQTDWLTEMVVDKVGCVIDVDNVLDWYNASQEFHISKLEVLTLCFVRENRNPELLSKAVERSMNFNDISKRAFEQDFPSREVILMKPLCLEWRGEPKPIYVIDPLESDPGVCYQCGHTDIQRLWLRDLSGIEVSRDIKLTFICNKVFYILCIEWRENDDTRLLSLWKYHHVSKTFQRVHNLELQNIYRVVSGSVDNTSFVQAFYDGVFSLFIEFEQHDEYENFIFKFDLVTFTLFDGFITTVGSNMETHKFLCKGHTYLVGDDYISDLNNFDFLNTEDHRIVKEYLNPSTEILELGVLTEEVMREGGFRYYQATKRGFYWIYCAEHDLTQERAYLVLKLDVANRTWSSFSSFVGNFMTSVVCGDRMYFVCVVKYGGVLEMKVKKILALNEDDSIVETVDFDVSSIPMFVKDYHVFPHHIL